MSEIQFFPDKEVDGHRGWYWDSVDTGAWDGPKEDWETSHKPLIQAICKPGVAIQAGGNLGMYPVLLADMFEHVITFEADPLNYAILHRNCEYNANITSYNNALSDDEGFCKIVRPDRTNLGMNYVQAPGYATEGEDLVYCQRLDEFLEGSYGEVRGIPVTLLMLDVEGHELSVLRGAEALIKKYEPVIFAERADDRVQSYLGELGYKLTAISKMDFVFTT